METLLGATALVTALLSFVGAVGGGAATGAWLGGWWRRRQWQLENAKEEFRQLLDTLVECSSCAYDFSQLPNDGSWPPLACAMQRLHLLSSNRIFAMPALARIGYQANATALREMCRSLRPADWAGTEIDHQARAQELAAGCVELHNKVRSAAINEVGLSLELETGNGAPTLRRPWLLRVRVSVQRGDGAGLG